MIIKPTVANSVKLTSSGKAVDGGAEVCGVILSAGNASATVVLHNSEDNSGTEKFKLSAVANSSEVYSGPPIKFPSGCYASISGTGAEVTIIYY